jgi:hypothetical protein
MIRQGGGVGRLGQRHRRRRRLVRRSEAHRRSRGVSWPRNGDGRRRPSANAVRGSVLGSREKLAPDPRRILHCGEELPRSIRAMALASPKPVEEPKWSCNPVKRSDSLRPQCRKITYRKISRDQHEIGFAYRRRACSPKPGQSVRRRDRVLSLGATPEDQDRERHRARYSNASIWFDYEVWASMVRQVHNM